MLNAMQQVGVQVEYDDARQQHDPIATDVAKSGEEAGEAASLQVGFNDCGRGQQSQDGRIDRIDAEIAAPAPQQRAGVGSRGTNGFPCRKHEKHHCYHPVPQAISPIPQPVQHADFRPRRRSTLFLAIAQMPAGYQDSCDTDAQQRQRGGFG